MTKNEIKKIVDKLKIKLSRTSNVHSIYAYCLRAKIEAFETAMQPSKKEKKIILSIKQEMEIFGREWNELLDILGFEI